ncbi:GxxExxY protein [Geobacter luticola]|uniref:GxxExxY protein n=2 Tax=Geomobilimonas luticola TaxID=1114878 RepID=A0ABS5SBB4_9BACT|nr:GxxExxY protein [Geomobilimonas luticola]
MEFKHTDITERVIKAVYTVFASLGSGFLEKVYENALMLELAQEGLLAQQQVPLSVRYRNQIVGEFFVDILVNDTVILELKAIEALQPIHEVQLVNYLKATDLEVGLLINFGPKIEIRRRVCSNKK